MNKNYLFLAILLIVLAAGLLVLPARENYVQITPENLMWDAAQPTRYFTVDQVAKMIIENDPTLELIDVRSIKDFDEFSIKNALNIPFDSLLYEDYQGYLGIEDMNAVFYSNDNIKADQAWVIAKRMGYKNIYVMEGGLNSWIYCIINPQMPKQTEPLTAFNQYNFRKGASIYFTGGELKQTKKTKSVTFVKRKKSTVAAGGC